MTNPTPHGKVPEALRIADEFKLCSEFDSIPSIIDIEKAEAELRRQHTRIAELESELEAVGAGGVQALSAAPVDELRDTLVAVSAAIAERDDRAAQKMIREILAASTTPPAEQQATKETSGGFHVWRDISTAPKDGSRFVATGHNYGLYSEVRHICVAQWFRGCWVETSDWNETSELKYLTHWMPLPSPPDDVAAPAEQQAAPKAAPGVGNSGFDHKTAADLLNNKTVSDEAVRKFVATSRWAHDERAALSATLLAMHGVLTSREAEIALLKKALLEAEATPKAAPGAAPGDALDEAMRERDDAEDFIDALLDEVLGHERPEWSNLYGRADALNDVQERMTSLHKPAVDKAWGQFQSAKAAPQPAPAPLSEMPYEKRKAIHEGEQIGASDAWFKARHEMLDTVDRRNVFRAGFDRGWSAALAAQGGK